MADKFEVTPDPQTGSVKINANVAGAVKLKVGRLLDDGTTQPVRPCDPWPFAQMHGVHDFECPFGGTTTYVLTPYDAAGLAMPPVTVAVALDTFTDDWLRPITRPLDGMKVGIESYSTLGREGRSSTFDVLNRTERLAVSMARKMPTGMMTIVTATDPERRAMLKMLATGEPLVFLSPSRYGIGRQYLTVNNVTESRIGNFAAEPSRRWTLDVEEIAFPTGYTTDWAFTSWKTLKEKKIDWQAVKSKYADWGSLPQAEGPATTAPVITNPSAFGY